MTYGKQRTCTSCGQESWTGEQCTRCFVAASGPHTSLIFDAHSGPVRTEGEPSEVVLRDPEWTRAEPMSRPRPVHDLERFAQVAGWRTRVVWSRGWEPAGSHVDLMSVRFSWPNTGRGAFAVYRSLVRDEGVKQTWAWSSVYVWGPDLAPFGGCGVTELKHYLKHQASWDAMELEEWVTGIRGGRGEAKAAADQRKADRAEVKRLAAAGVRPESLLMSVPVKRQGWTAEDVAKILAPAKRSRKSEEAS